MGLLNSLGLDQVEADPNYLADGKYAGEVFKSEYVYVKAKDTVSHVITYRVTAGERAGAQKAEWFKLGTAPVYGDNGQIVSMTPAMTEQAKPWYKKRLTDLGLTDADIANFEPHVLIGLPVTFGVKSKDGYTNINFVELRQTEAAEDFSGGGNIAGML